MSAAVLISREHVEAARRDADTGLRRFAPALEARTALSPTEFLAALSRLSGIETITLDAMHALAPAFDLIPYAEALDHDCVALYGGPRDAGRVFLVTADPLSPAVRAWAEERLPLAYSCRVARHADIAAYLAHHETTLRAMDTVLPAAAANAASISDAEDLSFQRINADSSTVVKLVHSTLFDALRLGASDVHLEMGTAGLGIKYRVDGVLTTMGALDGQTLAEQVLSRIKVMAELDIAERRVPQDGRFKVRAHGREIDFRVSVMPSIRGEDAVLRILDKQALSDEIKGLCLESLGFDAGVVSRLRRLAREPYGMLLVTGPTGSGKTTTLYAALTEINNGRDKIITIEDPVEYQLPGVLQIPVNEKKGLTFARGLRSILRHDPDKIMVGEIRDPETATIAVQSALTGHLVFTTVHANNVFDVIGRFLHMAVDPYSFVSALNGIVAQRLVRVICPHCAEDQRPGTALLTESGIGVRAATDMRFRHGRGCGECRGTGYRGRKAIAEVLYLNDDLREKIVARAPTRELRAAAQAQGMQLLREAALALVRQGETTLEEINRVTLVT
jgi:general secretion pathway protein E